MPNSAPPCCTSAEARHLADLPHVYQFDFDLYQCKACLRFSVYAWRAGQGGWESATAEDAQKMQTLDGIELRAFMKEWAKSCN